MADVTGQIQRSPGVCVSTLGPGAVNMTLGVANAYLDRSPLVAITATLARSASPVATHQDLDLNAVYRPFTKLALTLDGENTEAKVQHALATDGRAAHGPGPSSPFRATSPAPRIGSSGDSPRSLSPAAAPGVEGLARVAADDRGRPASDCDPRPRSESAHADAPAVRAFIEHMNVTGLRHAQGEGHVA